MVRFGQRMTLYSGDLGMDGTGGGPVETDGFLTVIIQGEDTDYTYANVKCKANDIIVGTLTWSYSARMDFEKAVSLTVPIRKGESHYVDWSDQRKADKLRIQIIWIPLTQ